MPKSQCHVFLSSNFHIYLNMYLKISPSLSLCQNTHFMGRPHKVVVVFQRVWGQVITRSTLRWYFHLSLRILQAEHEPQDIDWTTNSPWDDYKGQFTLHQQQQTLHRVLLNQRVNPVRVCCRWSPNEHSVSVCRVVEFELQQWKSSLKWWASVQSILTKRLVRLLKNVVMEWRLLFFFIF